MTNLVVLVGSFILMIIMYFESQAVAPGGVLDPTRWSDWDNLASYAKIYTTMGGANCFLLFVKIFKFLQLNKDLMIVFSILGRVRSAGLKPCDSTVAHSCGRNARHCGRRPLKT